MKSLIWLLLVCSVSSILAGIFVGSAYSEQCIGFGIIGLFVIVFPLFSYYRWKDKNISDYMLNKENIEKMRAYNNKKE